MALSLNEYRLQGARQFDLLFPAAGKKTDRMRSDVKTDIRGGPVPSELIRESSAAKEPLRA